MISKFKALLTIVCLTCLFVFVGVRPSEASESCYNWASLESTTEGNAIVSATKHDNYVTLKTTGGFSNIQFIPNYGCITSGQPMDKPSSSYGNENLSVLVPAGRKGSSDVANSFKTAMTGGAAVECDSNEQTPDKLNFWVRGDLVFEENCDTVTCSEVLLGQGHFGSTNNWWVAGPNMKDVSGIPAAGPLVEKCSGSTKGPHEVKITPAQPCASTFNLSLSNN